MADQQSDSRPLLMIVSYEGPADLGRISMRIGRNFSSVEYAHHPMVLSKTAPWRRKIDLEERDIARLFDLLQRKEIRKLKCKSPLLMPGQDISLKALTASMGKSPPFFGCEFVETPKELSEVLSEISDIYTKVRDSGK